jgi:CheY-like chemotaxis protein
MSEVETLPARVLVVEDEFLIRLTLVEALSDEGFVVLEADTGEAALSILQSDASISLLLTDIQLPGSLNGNTLVTKARETLPNLPVIFMTGRLDPADDARRSERDVFISKPYTLIDICQAAKRMAALSAV